MHSCHPVPVDLLLFILVCHLPFYWVTIKLLPEGPNVLLLGICRGNQLLHMIKEIIKPSGPHDSEGFKVSTLPHCMMLCTAEASLSTWTWYSCCTASKFLKINFLFSICTSFCSSVVSVLKQLFIMKCCCLKKLKSAQNIFVNQWCAINEQVLLLKSLFGLWYSESCLIKEECTFVLIVTEVNLKPCVICETVP